jgi:hypothetical protein
MTAVVSHESTATGEGLLDQAVLRDLHGVDAPWLRSVHGVLQSARATDAGPWARWRAIHYIDTVVSATFERERRAMEGVQPQLPSDYAGRLWAAAELVMALRWQLNHLIGACHHPADFATVTLKLEAALEHWCHEAEEVSGLFTRSEMLENSRHLLSINDQEAPNGT